MSVVLRRRGVDAGHPLIAPPSGPSFRSGSFFTDWSGSGTSPLVISAPAGSVTGDLLVAHIVSDGDTPPAGWTTLFSHHARTGSTELVSVYWRIHDGSSSYSWSIADASLGFEGVIAAYSGVNQTTPMDVAPSATTGNNTSAAVTGITTVTDGALLVYLSSFDNDDDTSTASTPSGFAMDYVLLAPGDVDQAWASKVQATHGAPGSVASTISPSQPWNAFLLALRPVARLPVISFVNRVVNDDVDPDGEWASGATGFSAGDICILATTSEDLDQTTMSASNSAAIGWTGWDIWSGLTEFDEHMQLWISPILTGPQATALASTTFGLNNQTEAYSAMVIKVRGASLPYSSDPDVVPDKDGNGGSPLVVPSFTPSPLPSTALIWYVGEYGPGGGVSAPTLSGWTLITSGADNVGDTDQVYGFWSKDVSGATGSASISDTNSVDFANNWAITMAFQPA